MRVDEEKRDRKKKEGKISNVRTSSYKKLPKRKDSESPFRLKALFGLF